LSHPLPQFLNPFVTLVWLRSDIPVLGHTEKGYTDVLGTHDLIGVRGQKTNIEPWVFGLEVQNLPHDPVIRAVWVKVATGASAQGWGRGRESNLDSRISFSNHFVLRGGLRDPHQQRRG